MHLWSKRFLAILACIILVSIVIAAIYNYVIHMTGQIHKIGVEVYADYGVTVISQLYWRNVFANTTYERFGYLVSTTTVNGTLQFTTYDLPSSLTFNLYYQTGSWVDSVWTPTSDWINLGTNPYLIQPDEWLRVKFQLTVVPDPQLGPFSFDIIISITVP